jgi:cholesterol transport system auxiliary component
MSLARARSLAVVLCATLSTGCTVLTPVKTDMITYVLSGVPADLPRQAGPSGNLLVLVPEIDPLYATRRMAYSTQAFQIGYYNESEWALAPAQMIQPLLVETMRSAGYSSEIASSSQQGRNALTLRTEILELKQDFSSEPAAFRVAMRFSLHRGPTRQLVGTKEVSVSETMRGRTAYAGVVAANVAIEKLLRALAVFAISNAN